MEPDQRVFLAAHDDPFHGILRPNASSDDIGLKRFLIVNSKGYRTVCMIIKYKIKGDN